MEVCDSFVPSPSLLNQPVKDVQEKCEEVGIVPFGMAVPLQDLLADVLQLPHE